MQMLFSIIGYVPQSVEIYVTAEGKLILIPKPTMTSKKARRRKQT